MEAYWLGWYLDSELSKGTWCCCLSLVNAWKNKVDFLGTYHEFYFEAKVVYKYKYVIPEILFL